MVDRSVAQTKPSWRRRRWMIASVGRHVAVLSASKLNAPDPHLPDWFRNQHAGQTLRGTYRVCIRQDGRVSDVYSIAGIPGADQAVIETVKSQWMFKPQGLPVCAPWVFVFKIN